jgi:hypothetical protein
MAISDMAKTPFPRMRIRITKISKVIEDIPEIAWG